MYAMYCCRTLLHHCGGLFLLPRVRIVGLVACCIVSVRGNTLTCAIYVLTYILCYIYAATDGPNAANNNDNNIIFKRRKQILRDSRVHHCIEYFE